MKHTILLLLLAAPLAAAQPNNLAVTEGLNIPPQAKLGQTFQISFTLEELHGQAVTLAGLALAIVPADGSTQYDVFLAEDVTIEPHRRWHITDSTHLFTSQTPGTYHAIVRGRLPNGQWFDFGTQGGLNPASFEAVAGASFGAVIEEIGLAPGAVTPGQHPAINATIRNTSTDDTDWQGYATFMVEASVRRNGVLMAPPQVWAGEPFEYQEVRTGFALAPSFDTSHPGFYEITYRVLSGDGEHHFATRRTSFSVAESLDCDVPDEAFQHQRYASFWTPPFGFNGATPWLAVLHDADQQHPSAVEIEYIRMMARYGGQVQTVSRNEYESASARSGGEICKRFPWFQECEPMPGQIFAGGLHIQPSARPEMVWHPWLETWPDDRHDLTGADSVWVEVRVRIHGSAFVQAGIDYWETTGYDFGQGNQEGAASDWVCAFGEHTLVLQRSTELDESIEFTIDGEPAVGNLITAGFSVRNHGPRALTLQELFVEIRRRQPGDIECYGQTAEHIDAFPAPAGPITIAPGEIFSHTSSWTPTQLGDYCFTVIEKRPSTPAGVYQRPYASGPHYLTIGSGTSGEGTTPGLSFRLETYPNPFVGEAVIELELSRSDEVRVAIYDLLGRQVALLHDGILDAGPHRLEWRALASSSGVYFVRVETPGTVDVRRLVHAR